MTSTSRSHQLNRTLVVASVAALLSTACGVNSNPEVVTSTAAAGVLSIAPAGHGVIAASIDQAIVSERRSTITNVNVVNGATVKAGQELLKLYTIGDSGAVAAATNQLRADQTQLESVRARDGVGASTTIALLNKVADDRAALASLKSAPTSVPSPINGTVSGLTLTAGAEVDRTLVIMHIVNNETFRITVPVEQRYHGLFAVNGKAIITVPGGSGASYTARVVGVGTAVDALAAGTASTLVADKIPITVEFPNPGSALTLGTSVYVRFEIDQKAAVAVNSLAVLGRQEQPYVFVVQDGRVHQHPVYTGVSDGQMTEIVTGVAVGDQVVISGGQKLLDGQAVSSKRSGAK